VKEGRTEGALEFVYAKPNENESESETPRPRDIFLHTSDFGGLVPAGSLFFILQRLGVKYVGF